MANDDAGKALNEQPIPRAQILMDDVFLLLAAGLIVPTLIYLVWGTVVMLSVPPMP
jgi:hypothetical protein